MTGFVISLKIGRAKALVVLHHLVEDRVQIVGNRLALAVVIRCEEDAVGVLRRLAQLRQELRLLRHRLELRLEPVLDVDAKLVGRQVADVPLRRQDAVLVSEVLPNGPRLGRRLDDDQSSSIPQAPSVAAIIQSRTDLSRYGPHAAQLRLESKHGSHRSATLSSKGFRPSARARCWPCSRSVLPWLDSRLARAREVRRRDGANRPLPRT